jgi:hypothetical protein
VVVPDRDPGELLVRKEQVKVGAVGCKTTPVVVQCEDFSLWLNGAGGSRGCILIDVVAKLNHCQHPERAALELSGNVMDERRTQDSRG